ncbi:MAG: hypothetical protein JO368_02990, partial [Acidimicrobiales bacterium]|nr:hypothetical protein [Acidimicrobiales bacterium]
SLRVKPGLTHHTIGDGWTTWSNGYAGDVYAVPMGFKPKGHKVTIVLPPKTKAFYLYAEGQEFGDADITATAEPGKVSSGPLVVYGQGGAQYFGFYSNGGSTSIKSVTVACTDTQGMAVGEFGISG